jgi:hypothetical protein
MDKQKISIDDLLARQSSLRPDLRVTIKPDNDGRVSVTPAVAGGECGCAFKITVNKEDIENVTPTDDVSDCCGEKLIVVEIAFANETVADIFRQLSETAAKSKKNRPIPSPHGRHTSPTPWLRGDPYQCWANYQACDESCGWSPGSQQDWQLCRDRCRQYYWDCMGGNHHF